MEVAATRPSLSLNLLTPFANDDVRVVEVQVGAPLPAEPFDGSGRSQQAATTPAFVSAERRRSHHGRKSRWEPVHGNSDPCRTTPDDQVMWMDSTGDLSQLSLERALQLWPEFRRRPFIAVAAWIWASPSPLRTTPRRLCCCPTFR